ncbi:MAG TPA: hypothetical protein VNE39_11495 [Planctomycetota bacterium]|nr:hypothetical protein [Planctomycetota bacterium]
MQLWVWRHIRVELPEDWEMLQFSRNPQAGRCAWADRYRFRAELSWQALSGPPDLARLASDYLAKLRLDGTMPDAAPVQSGDWRGPRGHEDGLLTSRLSRHLAEEGCLVELVLLWPDGLDPQREGSILASIRSESPWPHGLRRWRAFGLDALASGGLDLVECKAEPALAQLAFRDARATREETFQRLGMVPEWLDGSVRDWLVRQVPRDLRAEKGTFTFSPPWGAKGYCAEKENVPFSAREERAEASGHQVETVEGLRRGGLLRRPVHHAAAAWLCPSDGRLYCVGISGPDGADSKGLAGTRLSCCEGMTRRD